LEKTVLRRLMVLQVLCERRHDKIENLATEFNVSRRTMRYDIDILSLSFPIYTTKGKGGGIHIIDGYQLGMKYLTDNECIVLERVAEIANDDDKIVIYKIIKAFSKPKTPNKNRRDERNT